jgi:hypothetical protein
MQKDQPKRVCHLSFSNAFDLRPSLTHNLKQHAQYMTLQKYFSNPSLTFFFSNPTNQTKIGTVKFLSEKSQVAATQFSENGIFCHKFRPK